MANVKLVTKSSKLFRLEAWALSEMIFSVSPNFLKMLFSALVTASVVSLERVS